MAQEGVPSREKILIDRSLPGASSTQERKRRGTEAGCLGGQTLLLGLDYPASRLDSDYAWLELSSAPRNAGVVEQRGGIMVSWNRIKLRTSPSV